MRFIALTKNWEHNPTKMDVVHFLLFHGDAIRADAPANRAEWYTTCPFHVRCHVIGDDLSHPLLLIRSGIYVPLIFMPFALVVREELYQKIRDYPGLVFVDALPKKLIKLWKPIGDFSFYDSKDPLIRRNLDRGKVESLLEWMPNDPSLFAKFPRCYEWVAYNVHRYRGDEQHDVRVQFVMYDGSQEKEVEFSCSSSVIETYPLLRSDVFLIREDLFSLIEDAVDYDFFVTHVVDI
jgi:hypothetical protein